MYNILYSVKYLDTHTYNSILHSSLYDVPTEIFYSDHWIINLYTKRRFCINGFIISKRYYFTNINVYCCITITSIDNKYNVIIL